MSSSLHCPSCATRVQRIQKAAPTRPGVVILYGCQHWHDADTIADLVKTWRARNGTLAADRPRALPDAA